VKFTLTDALLRPTAAPMTLVLIVADGVRPDTLANAMDAGHLPALARLRAEGSSHTITTVFPSVTGSAYTPFLQGLHPGRAGVPGLRWYDRDRSATRWPAHARSYVGLGGIRADKDLVRTHRTLFELEPQSLGGFTYIGRGLSGTRRIGAGAAFAARMAWTHFRGDLPGWVRFDRWLGEEFARRIRTQRPRVAFLAHPGVDKLSHQFGQGAPQVLDALRTVDATVASVRADAERDGRAHEVWILSDHGHHAVAHHEDLAGVVTGFGYGVRAHPWVVGGHDVAVMVSGNAMAHLYLDLADRSRRGWAHHRARWTPLLAQLLARNSVDLALLPMADGACEVHTRDRGRALVSRRAGGTLDYRRINGDPLGLGEDLANLSGTAAWERTFDCDYPDALVQIAALAAAPRAGDLILSAAPGWDLRARWEPLAHVSGHGALHRDQMLVPLVMSRPATGTPRRTVDIFPSALRALGMPVPADLDGTSFR
jgi:hypothetical protein